MSNISESSSIEWWLTDIRFWFKEKEPSLLPLLEIYAAEAIFGRNYIASDLGELPADCKILEVGAGSLLLSCQLVREGYKITALEPIGQGFSHFTRMREIILERAAILGCLPVTLDLAAEALTGYDMFDYAFSINVMEHVVDISKVIANVGESLTVGGTYRFTAPNYLFPYEPHFNIPTLFSKRVTEIVFNKRIFGNKNNLNPVETWNSLNWINVIQVRKIVHQIPALKVSFGRRILVTTLERIALDPIFSSRRSLIVRNILSMMVKFQIHLFLCLLPIMIHPIMDCKIKKTCNFEKQ